MNSTLGSVVPLAMFKRKREDCVVYFLQGNVIHFSPSSSGRGAESPPCTPSNNFTDYAITLSVLKNRLDYTTNQGPAHYMFLNKFVKI